MELIEESEFFKNFCNENEITVPDKLKSFNAYEELQKLKDAEYIYCISYEMLIRTDEYNTLLKEYKPLKNKSKNDMNIEEFSKLRDMIDKMNDLGLKKTSFLGFDCDDDNDHVFKRIEYYDEVTNSPWNVRMVSKFQIDPSLGFDSIYHMLIDFYNKKNELYVLENSEFKKITLSIPEEDKSNQINLINNIHISEIYKLLQYLYIPCLEDSHVEYKKIEDIIYLKELDNDFLKLLKEKKNSNLLIPTKFDFVHSNIDFWKKYSINDIKNGLSKLIEYHINNNLIYNQNSVHINASKNEILSNLSNFYIPCVNRLIQIEIYEWVKEHDFVQDNNFIKKLEFDGVKSIVGDKGYITLKKEENIYLIQLSEYISLSLLDDSFLETLRFEDLKNTYINTDPVFKRPRLMFDEARLTNIPINLNLSKEDILLYLSQIKNEYDRDKNIVKTDEEYFFNLTLESDLTQMPRNIKHASEKRSSSDKKILPVKRQDFTKNFAFAFYIYDLFKFFVPFFKQKRDSIREQRDLEIKNVKNPNNTSQFKQNEIAYIHEKTDSDLINYENDNLLYQITYLLSDKFSRKQIEYYLTTMKEFIHGVNVENEYNVFKKKYNPDKIESPEPKYKNLIIGNSYIIKSNKSDLIKNLID